MPSTPNHASHVTSRPHGMSSMSRHVTHVTSRSHVSYYVPPQYFTSCSHVTSRPYAKIGKITSLTSQHVLTSRTSPRHATSPLNITPHVTSRHVPHVTSPTSHDITHVISRSHVTSLPMSRDVASPKSRPSHVTSLLPRDVTSPRNVPSVTASPRHVKPHYAPHVTSCPSSYITPTTPRPVPQVTSLASHLPSHVTSFASSCHVPPHITSHPTPTSFHVPTSRSPRHQVLTSRPSPCHVPCPTSRLSFTSHLVPRHVKTIPPSWHPFD